MRHYISMLVCLAVTLSCTVGWGQTLGKQAYLQGRDLLRQVTAFECRGEYVPPIPEFRDPRPIRVVFDGAFYRTEMGAPSFGAGVAFITRTYDGTKYQAHQSCTSLDTPATGITAPASAHYQVACPFDSQYGWSLQSFS